MNAPERIRLDAAPSGSEIRDRLYGTRAVRSRKAEFETLAIDAFDSGRIDERTFSAILAFLFSHCGSPDEYPEVAGLFRELLRSEECRHEPSGCPLTEKETGTLRETAEWKFLGVLSEPKYFHVRTEIILRNEPLPDSEVEALRLREHLRVGAILDDERLLDLRGIPAETFAILSDDALQVAYWKTRLLAHKTLQP